MCEKKGATPSASSSLQVWSQLGADRQAQIVRLMTQLAINLLMAQLEGSRKEEQHVKPISRAQSAS
jgi:hypothetical protein